VPDPSHEAEHILALALAKAQRQRSHILGTPHLSIALIKMDEPPPGRLGRFVL
jgi:hypothetical protein